ncbi:MAG: hypothetical protein IT307_06540, partial [Chloroflexi bacterium]|nr:hypothetical protein [Chloroflexota bacterium]
MSASAWRSVAVVDGLSKHLLRTRHGNVFKPAALALLLSVPLFSAGQSGWGARAELRWPWIFLLIALGAVIVDRVEEFPLILSFTGLYFSLLTINTLVDPGRVAELFHAPFIQAAPFFACFMLTEPPTAPGRYAAQVWIGILVAVVPCAAQLLGVGQSYLLVGILTGNLVLTARH